MPLAIYGPKDCGYRLGLLGAPVRIAQAVAPPMFGLLIDSLDAEALFVSRALSMEALLSPLLARKEAV